MPYRNTPVSSRENMMAMYAEKAPYWVPMPADVDFLHFPLYSDNLGRGRAVDITDAFGIDWEYVPTAGGSIVRAGVKPCMEDVNEWKERINFPDIDKWDWAGEAERINIDVARSGEFSFVNGFWFERLISFMEFMNAALALIDDDQKDAIHELFTASTEFGCKLVDKLCEYWPRIDTFTVHDDWGSQKAPFFSQETAEELFVPYMKILTDHIHSKGRFAALHSCGHNFTRVQCFIDGGFDQWTPQNMNDTHRLYDEVGDKIIIGVVPDPFNLETTSEKEQRERARDYVDRFCKPGKPSTLNWVGPMPQAFSEELYEYSRKKFAGLI